MKKEKLELIMKIAERAEGMDLLMFDRLSLTMDLKIADSKFNLRLKELLNTDNFNFSHDIVGIQQNIDRQNKTMSDFFVPRFAGI